MAAYLRSAVLSARVGLRARRRRVLVTGLGIALAAAMLAAAVVISYGLGTGFTRAAQAAGLPDILVRFADQPAARVAAKIRALPDVARFSLRNEVRDVRMSFAGHSSSAGVAEVLGSLGPRQGYAVVAGRHLPPVGRDVLVERGVASAWGLSLGSQLRLAELGPYRVVGFAEGPDDVGYPLAAPRVYLSLHALEARFGFDPGDHDPRVDFAQIWLRNPAYVNEVLAEARATSFGLRDIQFATRGGVRVLLDQAAGIVIDLLVALSVIALVTAGVLLAASARAEIQRRLGTLGVRRAIGETREGVALASGLEGVFVSLPAGTLGVLAGVLAVYGPSARLLELLNEPAPGWSLWLPLGGAWLAAVLLPAAGAAWPAWRAAGGPVTQLLRGGDVAFGPRHRRTAGGRARGGLGWLGVRLVAARRARLAATTLTLGLSAAFVLLMLALAGELSTLETDPGALGKRYALSAALPVSEVRAVARLPGVAAVAPRYEVGAADSFELGETIDVIAYPGNHVRFEAPELLVGHRLRGMRQAEVGEGLAQALGLTEGSVLALALPSGAEARFAVSGIVSSLDHEGRVAYVPAATLLRADPAASETLAVVVRPGADLGAVESGIARLGGAPAVAAGATARGVPLVNVLRTILRAVATVDGLVCLYSLVQACGLTVLERRRALSILRASGAGMGGVMRLLGGAAVALVVPAALVGVLLERFVFGPALSRLAENYAVLDLAAGGRLVVAVVVGLFVAGLLAAVWVARGVAREPVVEGLAG
jgi:ABC-type antimicrobial peptide transport system permease subunit